MAVTMSELTGRPDGPPQPLAAGVLDTIGSLGDRLALDPFEVILRRARLGGFARNGSTSAGGATRLLAAADGWIAVGLARPDDLDAVPAWLGESVDDLAAAVRHRRVTELVERAVLLGLPVAGVGEVRYDHGPVVRRQTGHRAVAPTNGAEGMRVVDASSLWAGPLCARILQQAGAHVTKLESRHRPDGARLGSPAFYDSLHSGQSEHVVEFRTTDGRRELHELLAAADVVIEGSRPRAFQQLGIDAAALLATARPRVWVSITAHGRGAGAERVGFGDDAAAAGGLVTWDDQGPCFVGDAIADPLTGMFAALAALDGLRRGGTWLLDASLARVAAFSARG